MSKPRKRDRITFRLTQDQRKLVESAAEKAKKDVGEFVRDLVLEKLGKAA